MDGVNSESLLLTSEQWDRFFQSTEAKKVNAICVALRLGLDIRIDGKDYGDGFFEFWALSHRSDPRFYGVRWKGKYAILEASFTHASGENKSGKQEVNVLKKTMSNRAEKLQLDKIEKLPPEYHSLKEEGIKRFQMMKMENRREMMRLVGEKFGREIEDKFLDMYDSLRQGGMTQKQINEVFAKEFGRSSVRRLNEALDNRGRGNYGGHLRSSLQDLQASNTTDENKAALPIQKLAQRNKCK